MEQRGNKGRIPYVLRQTKQDTTRGLQQRSKRFGRKEHLGEGHNRERYSTL
ncbi:hypothetical protein PISMIDRAFT_684564, partial [Pisolithus microcarpus 441]